jgi:imidazolonepropionase
MITLVTNIRQLVTPCGSGAASGPAMGTLRVIDDPILVLRGERILSVEPNSNAPRADRVIDAGGGVVVPGLVDACVTARISRGPASAAASPDTDLVRLRVGLGAMLAHGTTGAEVRAATDPNQPIEELLADLQQLTHRVPLRLSAAFVGTPRPGTNAARTDRISELIGETIPSVSRRRLAATCVVVCGAEMYGRKEARAVLRAAHGAGLASKVQASGPDAEAWLLAAECEAAAIDHLTGGLPPPRTLQQLKKAGTMAVLLPADAMSGEAAPVDARGFLAAGLPVALGSSVDVVRGGVYSLWTAVSLAVRRMGLSAAEALVAATLNSAAAVGIAHETGTLEPGKLADFVVLGVDDYRRIPDFLVGLPIRSVVVGGKEVSRP